MRHAHSTNNVEDNAHGSQLHSLAPCYVLSYEMMLMRQRLRCRRIHNHAMGANATSSASVPSPLRHSSLPQQALSTPFSLFFFFTQKRGLEYL